MIKLFACLAALSFVTGPALAQAAKRDKIVIRKKAEQDAPRDQGAKWHEIRQRIERLQKEILALCSPRSGEVHFSMLDTHPSPSIPTVR